MASKFVQITVDNVSLKQTLHNINQFGEQGKREAWEVIKRAAVRILSKSKRNIKKNDSIATSQLWNSGVVQNINASYTSFVRYNSNHAVFVEFGRKAGGFPPLDMIKQWIRKRGLADTYSIKSHRRSKRGADYEARLNSAAYLIGRKIANKGTRAKPFLYPALKDSEAGIIRELNAVYKRLIR